MSQKKNDVPFISAGQTFSVVLAFRIFTLMTFVPLIEKGYSLRVQLLSAAGAAVIQLLLIIPACTLFGKLNTDKRDDVFPSAVCAVYWIYFTAVSAGAAVRFGRFIDCRFGESLTPAATVLLLAAVCFYCALCGIEGIARASAVVLMFFAVMAVSVVGSSMNEFSLDNIRPGLAPGDILRGIAEESARSSELTLLCFLGKFTRRDFSKGAVCSVAGKFFVTAAVTSAVMLALGDYAYISRYPFLDLGSAAGVRFIQRIDAVYMMIWTVMAVISLSAQFFTAGDCLGKIVGCSLSRGIAFSAAVCTAGACLVLHFNIPSDGFFRAVSSLPVQAVTAAVIPLVLLVKKKFSLRYKEHPLCN